MTSGQPCALPLGRGELRQVGNRRRVVPGRPSAAAMVFNNLVCGEWFWPASVGGCRPACPPRIGRCLQTNCLERVTARRHRPIRLQALNGQVFRFQRPAAAAT